MPKAGWKKNPESGKFEPPPVEAARFDPDDAPIDGDYAFDKVLNKDPSKTYALVSAYDMPRMKGRGYVPTIRAEGGAQPAYDTGGDGVYAVNGQLTLMEIPKERADRIQRAAERRGAEQWQSQQQSVASVSGDRDAHTRTETNRHQQNARTWS